MTTITTPIAHEAGETLLTTILDRQRDEHESGIKAHTSANYLRSVKRFSEFLGEPAKVKHLTTERINAWLDAMKGTMKEASRKNHRTGIKVCINYAYEESLLEHKPRKIRKVTLEPYSPVAWSQSDVAKLIETARTFDGWDERQSPDHHKVLAVALEWLEDGKSYQSIADECTRLGYRTLTGKANWHRNTIRKLVLARKRERVKIELECHIEFGVYFASLIAFGWESGLRIGDLFDMRKSNIIRRPDGQASYRKIQQKTGFPVSNAISKETLELIDQCLAQGDQERDLVWPKPAKRKATFHQYMKRLTAKAGLEGTMKFIRRGAATAAENVRFGAGTELLGHRTRSITQNHYLDQSKLNIEGITLPSVLSASAIKVEPPTPAITGLSPEEVMLLSAYRRLNAEKRSKVVALLVG